MTRVVGTAGHIDHGKSTLIRALTGIDPDRLEEERRRGMTIDLGFAHLTLPSGLLVGMVDVPGHARFIRNMLAGVHGLDAVLLVVAADEGVMPQTREHLDIVELLEVGRGLIVLTKSDLVDQEWLGLVTEEVRESVRGSSLAGSEVIPVSAATGANLSFLVDRLDSLLAGLPERKDRGRPRLPIDRVFTVSGFGTVVTGTLVEGSIAVGEELEVLPSGGRVRIRGLQQHNRAVERAEPGTRVAANLVGGDRADLARGAVLARPGVMVATRRLDAHVRVLKDSARGLRHGAEVMVHAGTAEVAARAIVLEADAIEAGDEGWIQLYLSRPLAAAAGDRFVLRLPSPSSTVAGGRFADVAARRHPRHDHRVAASLERRVAGDVLQEELRKYPRGVTAAALLRASQAEAPDLERLEARKVGEWIFAPEAWSALSEAARSILAGYHLSHRLRAGMPLEELRSRLGLPRPAFAAVLPELAAEGVIARGGDEVALPEHSVHVEAGGAADRLLTLLEASPFAPPSLPDAMRESGAGPEVVRALVQRGDLVRVSDDVAFTSDAYRRAVELVRAMAAEAGSVTVAQLRDRMNASRRPVLALLERLDAERVTRRVGDARVLR